MELVDYQIIKAIKSRDETGIQLLLHHYGGLLRNIMQKHLYHFNHYTDECMNDTLLAIWNNIYQYDDTKSSFKNWVAVIAKYQSIDMLRKHAKEINEEVIPENAAYHDNPMSLWEMEWNDLISELSQEDQDLLNMIYIQGYKPEEAASITGRKTSNIYNRISRSKKKLKENGGYFK